MLGNLTSSIDADGRKTSYLYDASGQLTSKTSDTVEIDSWVKAGDAWALNPTSGKLTENYAYDSLGRRVQTTNAAGETTKSYYDVRGNLVALQQPLGQTERYAYDVADRKVADLDANGYLATWSFAADTGKLIQSHDIGGADTSYAYDKRGLLVSQGSTRGTDQQFSYDAAGNRTQYTNDDGTRRDYNYYYAYDAMNRPRAGTALAGPGRPPAAADRSYADELARNCSTTRCATWRVPRNKSTTEGS